MIGRQTTGTTLPSVSVRYASTREGEEVKSTHVQEHNLVTERGVDAEDAFNGGQKRQVPDGGAEFFVDLAHDRGAVSLTQLHTPADQAVVTGWVSTVGGLRLTAWAVKSSFGAISMAFTRMGERSIGGMSALCQSAQTGRGTYPHPDRSGA